MKDIGVVIILLMQEKDAHSHLPSLFRSVKVMMAASSADYKDDGRKEKKEPVTEEGSKPIRTSDLSLHMAGTTSSKGEHRRRAYCTLTVPIIILYAVVVVAVSCGAGAFVHVSTNCNSVSAN